VGVEGKLNIKKIGMRNKNYETRQNERERGIRCSREQEKQEIKLLTYNL
jgi:hypothetical protein